MEDTTGFPVVRAARPRPSRFSLGLLLLFAGAIAATTSLRAQEVRGTVVEARSGSAIAGAFVSLLDDQGDAVASTLSGADGSYVLRAPRADSFLLRVERIGYTTWTSDPLRLRAGQGVARTLSVPVEPIRLDMLAIDVQGVCGRRAGAGFELARIWEEARKALELTRWTETGEEVEFELRRYERDLDPETGDVITEMTSSAEKRAWRTFVSAPAEELSSEGYVRPQEDGTWEAFAPDADVLLSEAFAGDHCFEVVSGADEDPGLIGLAFEPVPGRTVSDVAGTLWLDGVTSELRRLSFRYTGTGFRHAADIPAGGEVEFSILPTGHWFVRRWHIRMPVAAERARDLVVTPGGGPARARRDTLLARIREVGGEVVGADLPDGRRWTLTSPSPEEAAAGEAAVPTETERLAAERCAAARADGPRTPSGEGILLGRIVDAGTREVVPEAMVWVGTAEDVGAGGWYTASEAGVFLLCGLPTGSEIHLQASTGGLLSERVVVRLTPEDRVALRDIVVSGRDIAGRSAAGRVEGTLLRGIVRAADTGEPLSGASVQVIETSATTLTSEDGTFSFLGLPGGTYHLMTQYLGRTSDTVAINLSEDVSSELAVLSLETRAIELPALRVEVQRSSRLAGFHHRRERGLGDFITREDLERADVVANFRRILGVRVQMGGRSGTYYRVRLARGGGLAGLQHRSGAISGGDCGPPLIYWNGALITSGFERQHEMEGMGAFERLRSFPRDLIEGIEVYRNPATAPGPYRSLGDQCGIILVWTRDRSGPR